MTTFTVTGDDTVVLNGRVLGDLATDDVSHITFPNELVKMKTGKNQNTIFAKDETGNNGSMAIRLVRGSSDDQFMQGVIAQSQKDFVATVLLTGQFVKRLGDGQGNTLRDVYLLQGGVISKQVEGKENTSGDVEQAVSVYTIMFALATRSIQ